MTLRSAEAALDAEADLPTPRRGAGPVAPGIDTGREPSPSPFYPNCSEL